MKSHILIPAIVAGGLAGPGMVQAVEFEADILPILSNRCGKCHLEGNSKGGVALDLDEIPKEIGSSKAIVPGDSAKSDLLTLITLPEDDEDRMPPVGKGSPVSDREAGMIKAWIDEGAKIGAAAATEEKMAEKDAEAAKPAKAGVETWTNTAGKSISATITRVDVARRMVVFLLENGNSVEVPIANLSEESRSRAKAYWEANQ